jgi:hypothetical protein
LTFSAAALPTGSSHSTVYAVAEMQDPSAETDCIHSVVAWGDQGTNRARLVFKGCGHRLGICKQLRHLGPGLPQKPWRSGSIQVARADFSEHRLSVWMDGSSSYTWTQSDSLATGSGSGVLGGTTWDSGSG